MPDESADYFRQQASKCRTLAGSTLDQQVAQTLQAMAVEYEAKARPIQEKADG